MSRICSINLRPAYDERDRRRGGVGQPGFGEEQERYVSDLRGSVGR
jgi:hypothetical protein